jgi:acyl-CoA reductase-like NAD-dependent aldehyde dehydrogenase
MDATSIVFSKADLRTLAAAHIAAAMMAAGDRDPGEDVIRNRADVAVKIAKAIEEAVTRSLKVEPPADPPPRPSVGGGNL